MQTMQDLINQDTADVTQIGTDQSAIVSDQAKLDADNSTLTTDQSKAVSDSATFDAALTVTGPVGSVSPDGSTVTIYAAAGAVIPANTPIPLASSVAVPPPPEPPAVIPSS